MKGVGAISAGARGMALLCASLLVDDALARCQEPGSMAEPERIRRCLEDFRIRSGVGPETLYHWGDADSIARMMRLPREAFCGFDDSRQQARRELNILAQEHRGTVPAPVLADTLAGAVAAVPPEAFVVNAADEDAETARADALVPIEKLELASERVDGYLDLLDEVLERHDTLVEESRCQRERPPAELDCPSVSDDAAERTTARRLDSLSRALVELGLALFAPHYVAPPPTGTNPVDRADAAVAAEMLRGYITEIETFVDNFGPRTGPDGEALYGAPPAPATTWGRGVYFSQRPDAYASLFRGGGIACFVGGKRLIDAWGRDRNRRSVRREQLIEANVLTRPSATGNTRHAPYADADAFELATRHQILRMTSDIYVSKCAVEYERCGAITVFDFDDCTAIGAIASSIPSRASYESASRDPPLLLFRYLREGPGDGTRRHARLEPKLFDSRLLNEWHRCLRSQLEAAPAERLGALVLANLCPASLQGRRRLLGQRSGPALGIYTDPGYTDPEGFPEPGYAPAARYLPLVKKIAELCKSLSET